VERTDTSAAEDDSDIADQENTDEYEENNTTGGTILFIFIGVFLVSNIRIIFRS
jgi:hypothetical protein